MQLFGIIGWIALVTGRLEKRAVFVLLPFPRNKIFVIQFGLQVPRKR